MEVENILQFYKIPFYKILEYVKICGSRKIVSAYSSNPECEYYLYGNGVSNLITVGKNYNGDKTMKPKYPTVDLLITHEPDIVENCALLLIWPDRNSDSDYDAIMKLKPVSIVLIYDTTNNAGGFRLQSWVNSQTEYSDYCEYNVISDGISENIVMKLLTRDNDVLLEISKTETVHSASKDECVIQ